MFRNVYFISSVGSLLMASNGIWLYGLIGDNVNSYEPETVNRQIIPKVLEKDYVSKRLNTNAGGFYVTPTGTSPKDYYLIKPKQELNDFSLNFRATKEGYLEFNKEEIGIRLFRSSAWSNDGKEDEYGDKLSVSEVKSLFTDNIDEFKVKQLLLSLSVRRDWTTWYTDFWNKYGIVKPTSLDDLKNLKIKYFRDFESLKNYVHTKVKSCIGEKKSCIAGLEELSIIDQDKLSFFKEN